MPGFGVVVNPHAGRGGRGTGITRQAAQCLGEDGRVYETATVAELGDVVDEFHRRTIDVLVISGGDGSLHPCLSLWIEKYGVDTLPPVLVLRAGTVNTIAKSLGVPAGRPVAALASAIRRYRDRGRLEGRWRQTLVTEGKRYGFMTGAGTIVSFLEAYYAGPRQGSIGAAQLILRLVASSMDGLRLVDRLFRWVDAHVTCDGQPVPFATFSAIYASTIKDIGLGFRPTYRAGDVPDTFHLIAGPISVKETVSCLPRIRRGVPTGSPMLFDSLARSVEIEFRDPSPYMIDGDVLEPVQRLTIEAGPPIRVVTAEEVS